jgi:hypothetical protein
LKASLAFVPVAAAGALLLAAACSAFDPKVGPLRESSQSSSCAPPSASSSEDGEVYPTAPSGGGYLPMDNSDASADADAGTDLDGESEGGDEVAPSGCDAS